MLSLGLGLGHGLEASLKVLALALGVEVVLVLNFTFKDNTRNSMFNHEFMMTLFKTVTYFTFMKFNAPTLST